MSFAKIPFEILKTAFGFYLISDIRQRSGKEKPTEADIKKLLLKTNKSAELQSAKQISRYCATDKNYLLLAREDTLEKVATLLDLQIKELADFRQKLHPAYKTFKEFQEYLSLAEQYLIQFSAENPEESKAILQEKFKHLMGIDAAQESFISMISYNFGEKDSALPAFNFAAENDLKTERVLRDLFKSYGFKIPLTIPSQEAIKNLKKNESFGAFFAIGLANNELTKWAILQPNVAKMLEFDEKNTCIRLFGEKNIELRADRNEQIDYAILLKLRLKKQKNIFVLGGIEGFGTEKIGSFFQENWQKIPEFQDEVSGKIIGEKGFLAVFKVSENGCDLIKCVTT